MSKEDVIKDLGRIFYQGGYTTEKYTEAMLEKEKNFNTAIGNSLGIPHGIESMRGEIKHSGLAVFTFPEGTDWGDGETVKLVIGVAAIGNDHMATLARIADACESEEKVDEILKMDVDSVYELFKA